MNTYTIVPYFSNIFCISSSESFGAKLDTKIVLLSCYKFQNFCLTIHLFQQEELPLQNQIHAVFQPQLLRLPLFLPLLEFPVLPFF
jgi:hypothetical protein